MIYTEWDKLKEVIVGSSYDINSLNQFNDTEFLTRLRKIFKNYLIFLKVLM
jgi:hypothetical protein